jgi:hypothetical protein
MHPDARLERLEVGIGGLSSRAQAALFHTCAVALSPLYEAWAQAGGMEHVPLLKQVIAHGRAYALGGALNESATRLLREMERAAPPGEAIGSVDSTLAQDAWICADASLRVVVQPASHPGDWLEYALNPLIVSVTEDLYGVAQLGSGEDDRDRAVLGDPRVTAAIERLDWAVSELRGKDAVSERELSDLLEGLKVLVP